MACGRPVVALGRGGAAETVVPGVSGELVDTQTPEAFADAMDRVRRTAYDSSALMQHAAQYSTSRFEQGFRDLLTRTLAGSSPC